MFVTITRKNYTYFIIKKVLQSIINFYNFLVIKILRYRKIVNVRETLLWIYLFKYLAFFQYHIYMILKIFIDQNICKIYNPHNSQIMHKICSTQEFNA